MLKCFLTEGELLVEKYQVKPEFTQKQIKNLVKKLELVEKDLKELHEIKEKRTLTPLENSFLHSMNEAKTEIVKELKEIVVRLKKHK